MTGIRHNTGFAMVDALVALLLFALVLLAAIAALIQGMRATHAAVLTGHAVDLAADLLEQRRALPDGADSRDPCWQPGMNACSTELPATSRPYRRRRWCSRCSASAAGQRHEPARLLAGRAAGGHAAVRAAGRRRLRRLDTRQRGLA